MKYQKERKFVKEAFDEYHKEIKVSTIIILESAENKEGQIERVLFEDRFGEQYEVRKNKFGNYVID